MKVTVFKVYLLFGKRNSFFLKHSYTTTRPRTLPLFQMEDKILKEITDLRKQGL